MQAEPLVITLTFFTGSIPTIFTYLFFRHGLAFTVKGITAIIITTFTFFNLLLCGWTWSWSWSWSRSFGSCKGIFISKLVMAH
jgi:hypothetical protein